MNPRTLAGEIEERFRTLFQEAPVAYREVDREGFIRRVNHAACDLLGFEPLEIVGRPFWDFIIPSEREAAREGLRRKISREAPGLSIEREYITRDGTTRLVEIHDSLIRDSDNAVVGLRSAMLDITERKRAEQALSESNDRYRDLFENANDIIFTLNLAGNFTSLNKTGERVTGYSRKEPLHISQILAPRQSALVRRMLDRGPAIREHVCYELKIIAKDGRVVPVEVSTRLIHHDGKIVGVQGIARDITERKHAEAALRESEERYALAVRGASDGLWDWNLKTNTIYFSPRWKAMLGYQESEIGLSPDEWFCRVHPEDLGRLKLEIGLHLEGHNAQFEYEHRIAHKDGSHRWMLARGLAVRDAEGRAVRMAGSQADMTLRKVAEERLLHDAFHDELTGLPNRTLFMDRLERAAIRAMRRENYLFAVLFLDLDRFKVINDSLGHLIGDQLLIGIARRLEACLRPQDTVARLGGDEFVVLCDDLRNVSDATQLAERIQKELNQPFTLSSHEVFTSASIGIALSSTGYQQPEDLLRDADTVMYRAKALGKARYEVFHAGLHTRAVERLHLENDLRRAVERHEFVLLYQPIVSRESGEITCVEALLRWQHPHRGLLEPPEFLAVAEETGVIVPIGEWVLRTACTQCKVWQQPGTSGTRVAINVSPRQFKQPNLIETITRALADADLDPRCLELDLTEGTVLDSANDALEIIEELFSLGIRIAIDDFGTGYSSLKNLLRFPISTLKIDRSFVRDIDTDPDSAAIAVAVITLAHSLKLNVVAEGVESAEQLEFLTLQGCNQMQGRVFSEPVPGAEASVLLSRRYLASSKPASCVPASSVPQLS